MDILFERELGHVHQQDFPNNEQSGGCCSVSQIILAEILYRVANDALRDAKGLEVLEETVIPVRCPWTVPVGDRHDTCRSCTRDT